MGTRQLLVLFGIVLIVAAAAAVFALGIGGFGELLTGTPTGTGSLTHKGLAATPTPRVEVVTATSLPATGTTEAATSTPISPTITATVEQTTVPTQQPTAATTPTAQAVTV